MLCAPRCLDVRADMTVPRGTSGTVVGPAQCTSIGLEYISGMPNLSCKPRCVWRSNTRLRWQLVFGIILVKYSLGQRKPAISFRRRSVCPRKVNVDYYIYGVPQSDFDPPPPSLLHEAGCRCGDKLDAADHLRCTLDGRHPTRVDGNHPRCRCWLYRR